MPPCCSDLPCYATDPVVGRQSGDLAFNRRRSHGQDWIRRARERDGAGDREKARRDSTDLCDERLQCLDEPRHMLGPDEHDR